MTDNKDLELTKLKVAVLVDACASAAKHYENYHQRVVVLDTKAQGVATVSGLVLAVTAAFSKEGRPPILVHSWWWLALVLAIPVLALAAVMVSMRGALVGEMSAPFDAPSNMRAAESVRIAINDQSNTERIFAYYTSQLELWRESLDGTKNSSGMKNSVKRKAQYVSVGQRLLMTALALLTVLFGFVLFAARSN